MTNRKKLKEIRRIFEKLDVYVDIYFSENFNVLILDNSNKSASTFLRNNKYGDGFDNFGASYIAFAVDDLYGFMQQFIRKEKIKMILEE